MATDGRMKFDMRDQAFAMISLISNRLTAGAASALREFAGLTVNENRIMLFIHAGMVATAAEAARFIAIDQAAISRSVQRLMERGYVVAAPDQQHAKRILLSLTDQGERYAKALWRFNKEREDQVLAVLSAAERVFFLDLLARVMGNVDAASAVRLEEEWKHQGS